MRGKGRILARSDLDSGITPAHAGKSSAHMRVYAYIRDHPRPCGEKVGGNLLELFVVGSPPPMRGKVPRHAIGVVCCGITPAHAGKRNMMISVIR